MKLFFRACDYIPTDLSVAGDCCLSLFNSPTSSSIIWTSWIYTRIDMDNNCCWRRVFDNDFEEKAFVEEILIRHCYNFKIVDYPFKTVWHQKQYPYTIEFTPESNLRLNLEDVYNRILTLE